MNPNLCLWDVNFKKTTKCSVIYVGNAFLLSPMTGIPYDVIFIGPVHGKCGTNVHATPAARACNAKPVYSTRARL